MSEGKPIDRWWAAGERIEVQANPRADTYRLFVHEDGEGPWVTFLHGFPTSSWDWAPLLEHVSTDVTRHCPDLLGFGDSDKPAGHAYSLVEQLDLVADLWDQRGVERTWLVAHDYSVSMVQELLARIDEGSWDGPEIEAVTMLNGGLFYSRIETKLIQDLLRAPVIGAVLGQLIPQGQFERSFSDVFSPAHQPSPSELEQHWRSITRRGGRRIFHRVARYQDERREHEVRWTRAIQDPPCPVRYVWGPLDPVSGAHMLEGVREHVPDPDIVELQDIAHYPQLEAPERVAEHLLLPSS